MKPLYMAAAAGALTLMASGAVANVMNNTAVRCVEAKVHDKFSDMEIQVNALAYEKAVWAVVKAGRDCNLPW